MGAPDLHQRACLYANAMQIAIDQAPFDGGQDGSVWHSDRNTVIKVFERRENYEHELECYLRLKDAKLGWKIHDFNVPALQDCSAEHLVIEMGIVEPPYILDFGKAYFKRRRPQFSPEVMRDEIVRQKEIWGDYLARDKVDPQ